MPSWTAPVSFAVRTGESTARVLAALALIDPRRAVALAEHLADNEGTRTFAGESRLRVASLLALRGDGRWRHIDERELNLWNSLRGVD